MDVKYGGAGRWGGRRGMLIMEAAISSTPTSSSVNTKCGEEGKGARLTRGLIPLPLCVWHSEPCYGAPSKHPLRSCTLHPHFTHASLHTFQTFTYSINTVTESGSSRKKAPRGSAAATGAGGGDSQGLTTANGSLEIPKVDTPLTDSMAVTGADMVDYDMSYGGEEEGGGGGGSAVGAGGGTMAGIDSMLGSGGLGFGSVAESGAVGNSGLGFGSMAESGAVGVGFGSPLTGGGTMEVMVSGVMANNLVGSKGAQAPVVVTSSGGGGGSRSTGAAAVGGVVSGGAKPGVGQQPLAPIRLGLVEVAEAQGTPTGGGGPNEVRQFQPS